MNVKLAVVVLSVFVSVSNAFAKYDFESLKSAVAYVESGNGNLYRYEPRFYERYLRGRDQWLSVLAQHGKEAVSASHGKYHIMYTTAYLYGFRGSPEELKSEAVQEQLFDKIFSDLLKIANGNYNKAIQYYNAGPKRKSPKYLKKVKKAYDKVVRNSDDIKFVSKPSASKKVYKIAKAKINKKLKSKKVSQKIKTIKVSELKLAKRCSTRKAEKSI